MEPQFIRAPSPDLASRLHDVACCPFATSEELHALKGRALLSNFRRNIASLRQRGLIQSAYFRSRITGRSSARHFLTREGLKVLSEWLGQPESVILRQLPVSAEWQRVLLGRMEALVLVYRIAVQVARCRAEAGDEGQISVLFPRDDPLDGIISCSDSLWFGVVRQGHGLSLSNLGRRLKRQARKRAQPAMALIVTADGAGQPPVTRRVLEWRSRFTGVTSFEGDISSGGPEETAWTLPGHFGGESLSLRDVVRDAVGLRIYQPFVKMSYKKASHPVPLVDLPETGWAELPEAQRQTLEDVFLWPLMDIRQLAALRSVPYANKALVLSRLVDLGLVVRMSTSGLSRRRFALSDEGLRYVASRDRTSLGALRERWSPASDDEPAGTMLGKLELESSHSEGVNHFAARLQTECGGDACIMSSLRGIRHFSDSAGTSQVSPDLIADLSQNGSSYTVFLEYEMRAVSSNPMRDKLLPWLRYFGTAYPREDFSGDLKLLFVLFDRGAEETFHEVAGELISRTRVDLPLVTTHKDLFDESSTALTAAIWRTTKSSPDERGGALSVRPAGHRSGGRLLRGLSECPSDEGESPSVPEVPVPLEPSLGSEPPLGEFLRGVRIERRLSLRDVQRLARQHGLGPGPSNGYLSVLERGGIKSPSPRILQTLAAIYEIDYFDLLRMMGYIPSDADPAASQDVAFSLRGVSQLTPEQRRRIQRIIDLELGG